MQVIPTPQKIRNVRYYWNPVRVFNALVFKNGVGLISTKLTLPKGKSTVEADSPQNALHGTIWVTSTSPEIS